MLGETANVRPLCSEEVMLDRKGRKLAFVPSMQGIYVPANEPSCSIDLRVQNSGFVSARGRDPHCTIYLIYTT